MAKKAKKKVTKRAVMPVAKRYLATDEYELHVVPPWTSRDGLAAYLKRRYPKSWPKFHIIPVLIIDARTHKAVPKRTQKAKGAKS